MSFYRINYALEKNDKKKPHSACHFSFKHVYDVISVTGAITSGKQKAIHTCTDPTLAIIRLFFWEPHFPIKASINPGNENKK